jgi:hypothetical protein
MPSKNTEQIKIWKPAHEWLMQVSQAFKARGESSASMTALASQAILNIPMPNGNGITPVASTAVNGEAGSGPCEEEKS